MQTRKWLTRSGLVLAMFGAAGLMAVAPAGAQTQKPATTAETGKSTTMAPARGGDDNAAEFAKLDKNKDGFIDKGEAVMEPKLLGKWASADTNKDGKISKEEFLAFERQEHTAKK